MSNLPLEIICIFGLIENQFMRRFPAFGALPDGLEFKRTNFFSTAIPADRHISVVTPVAMIETSAEMDGINSVGSLTDIVETAQDNKDPKVE